MQLSLPPRSRRLVTWLVLSSLILAGAAWWWTMGRPVAMPDAPPPPYDCVSYTPFHRPGETPFNPHAFVSPASINADLRLLSRRFNCVRTYSQGQGMSALPAIAARYHMQVLMGIWLSRNPQANARQIALGIATARAAARAHPGVLRGVIVGNEVLLRGDLPQQQLAAYIHQVRAALPASIPVSYADVWEDWMRHPQLAPAVDFITVHILPYWENRPVPVGRAVAYVKKVYTRVQHAFPHKRVIIGETGWPSAGRPRWGAKPSLVNEARFVRGFLRYARRTHIPYNIVEAFDQPWKRALEGTVGGYWGIYDADGQPKFPLQGPVVEIAYWWLGWLAGVAGACVFLLAGWRYFRRRRVRGWLAMGLAGAASGMALAWQVRQMIHACVGPWGWTISIATCLAALLTTIWLARWLAGRLAGTIRRSAPAGWLRFAWLFALALYGLLLVFDGRYRGFPLGLFALPCVGYALTAWMDARPSRPSRESVFLAAWLPVLAAVVVALEHGEDPSTWLWLVENLAIALAVLVAWWRTRFTPKRTEAAVNRMY